jgi:hypothetical protein
MTAASAQRRHPRPAGRSAATPSDPRPPGRTPQAGRGRRRPHRARPRPRDPHDLPPVMDGQRTPPRPQPFRQLLGQPRSAERSPPATAPRHATLRARHPRSRRAEQALPRIPAGVSTQHHPRGKPEVRTLHTPTPGEPPVRPRR